MMNLRFPMKDIAYWPRPIRMVAIVLIFALIFLMGFDLRLKHRLNDLHQAHILQKDLKHQLTDSDMQLKNIKIYQQESDKLIDFMNASYARFMPASDAPSLINLVLQKANSRGLQVSSFNRLPTVSKDFYSSEQMQLFLIGSYYQFAQFCNDLVSLKTIVRVGNFTMALDAARKDPDLLSIQLAVDLYYVNPLEEV